VPGSVSLGDLVTFRGVDAFCDERYRGRAFRSDAPMSPDLARFLEGWLTGDWHRAIPLSPETWATFRNKVLSILNEQALTLRWQSAGVPIYDLRFLRALRARSGTPLAEIPRARLEPFAQSLFRQKQYAEPAMSRVLARLRSMGRRWRRLAPSV
jgi:hypothetical protein